MIPVLEILLLLAVAKAAGELAERIGYPGLVGEIGAGLILGPSILGLIEPGVVIEALADLGLILLLFLSGVQTDLKNLASAEMAGSATAVGGIMIPLLLGSALGLFFGMDSLTAIFLGVVLSITSIGISIRTLVDEHALSTPVGSIIITTAVIDDIIGILLLAFLMAIAFGDGIVTVLGVAAAGIIFIILMVTVAPSLLGSFYGRIRRGASHETAFSAVICLALGGAALTSLLGLHLAIGAFFVGLALSDRIRPDRTIEGSLSDLAGGFLITIFFASIGLSLLISVSTFIDPLLLPLIVVAFISKILGGYLGSRRFLPDSLSALLVGIGITPRGEMALVVATVALAGGFITDSLYATVTMMVVITVLISPVFLRWGFKAHRQAGDA
ncbi:cation:proton antiporter [Methanocalculus chunghsingensis]|nr:cation:proton antiporter [Methanocalculus chunghsingensis]